MKEQRRYDELIKKIREDKADIMETAAELFNGDMRESLGELSLADNHPADIGTEVYQRSRDVAEHDRLGHRIEAIDGALERFEKGEYAKCEHCGQEIPYERLEVLPYTGRTEHSLRAAQAMDGQVSLRYDTNKDIPLFTASPGARQREGPTLGLPMFLARMNRVHSPFRLPLRLNSFDIFNRPNHFIGVFIEIIWIRDISVSAQIL